MASVLLPHDSINGHGDRPHVIDRLFPNNVVIQVSPRGATGTKSNLVETRASFVLQLALPGIHPASLEIQVVARRLTVKGTYRPPQVETGSYLWHDLADTEFCDMFELPEEADGDKAEAHYDRGILSITLPRVGYLKPASIPVHMD